ncbi:uncharacterized protein B0H64DRAFT_459684 [Chaetomium fimeti]|uniref:Uncharacterized protein n=1 Tax=Chaetomium fimeti TaxID=1854472 RepID=A0AAE0HF84_9PEZI|nr:hypothetical protein B0H64DRAFT_459684 [Chaetomium fimeti]
MPPVSTTPSENEGFALSGNNPLDTVRRDAASDDASTSDLVNNQLRDSLSEGSDGRIVDGETVLANARAAMSQHSTPTAAMKSSVIPDTVAPSSAPPTLSKGTTKGTTSHVPATPTAVAPTVTNELDLASVTETLAKLPSRPLTPDSHGDPRPAQHVGNMHRLACEDILDIARNILVPALKHDLATHDKYSAVHMVFPFLRNDSGGVEGMEVAVWWLMNLVRMAQSGRYTLRHS